ncbi:HAMP domain-containing histidine kinase [Paracoccus liaowanqingii]|uniref:histidine kinase n=1 Tax=Paracoccus liaowanqingii TaxID=2560053 RepID=A0A4Z1BJ01_9RHOB|nr:HAMP domain-containing sensor histidine kinase [Paracoccus liaowanqingii]TGN55828.1 HAMP domain-containing histidine kinase [Paracoccus liaowanqingii]
MSRRRPSLKWPLILQPLLFQFVTLFISIAALTAIAVRADVGGQYADERITPVIARSIVRLGDGRLEVGVTPELFHIQRKTPDLWFVVENDAGQSVTFGNVPSEFVPLIGKLTNISYAILRDRFPPYRLSAVVRTEVAPAGTLTVLAHGQLTEMNFVVLMTSNLVTVPVFLLLALISLIITPWIVRRSLAGVNRIAQEAGQITTNPRGWRLAEDRVAIEILPLVCAVNDVLRQLDEDYERQRRFIASAAHELRTPIAILRIKVEAADEAATRQLGGDVDRLANLAEQLLDLQRLDAMRNDEDIDLVTLVRQVAADLAPLLIASHRTIEVMVEASWSIRGDVGAIKRVVTNLVQNAIEHGGRHVVIRVQGSIFEVVDDGPGIPIEERERVFEPFHRLRPRSTGTGLGLNLVQQVVELHGGHVSIIGAIGGGTIVRVEFPT